MVPDEGRVPYRRGDKLWAKVEGRGFRVVAVGDEEPGPTTPQVMVQGEHLPPIRVPVEFLWRDETTD